MVNREFLKIMTKEKLKSIKDEVKDFSDCADRILSGEQENYDGADGARYVSDLCSICESLIEELEIEKQNPLTY